ncbi:hypothetical protein ABFT23_07080 [Nocardioides sp. C4-1]|uniref:hypothetical protein n=1 Tax=Nocardioides sp. C4-1 TaxID=3151851 RepID=UPI003267126F
MKNRARPTERDRAVSVVSLTLTLVGVFCYLALSDGQIATTVRGFVLAEQRVRPAVVTDSTGSHRFLHTQPGSGEPVGFNPCAEVRYVVNPAGAPSSWRTYVDEAVGEVEARTGLELVYDGPTDDRAFADRIDAGGRPLPVLIGWADESEVDQLADAVAGIGGPTMVELGEARSYVTGSVVLDRETTERLDRTRHGPELQVSLLMHELAHLVGLDHVDDPTELMHPEGVARTTFGPGDLEGLAALGAIGCA